MTEVGPVPTTATQPELPLRQPVATRSPATVHRRLDARTRAIGRQGVAAARAALAGTSPAGAADPNQADDSGRNGAVGRAAAAKGRRVRAA